ncbi:signal peptidase I [Glutamicibacter sp. PS]|uniref:signal peptidase I n=1 Tax=Glutamicibacter sp. PS TaxID=3075634 RepID=UPI00284C90FD|nr:signal peptidase I [Glutamicibacter sp. PS]MDR4532923.1 signal peptidase I [Glutamicibacter sp. PS]
MTSEPVNPPEATHGLAYRIWRSVREILLILVIAIGLSLIIKTFFFRAYYIPSGSMENTLQINDRIFANLMVPGPFDLERGDVVVFRDDLDWLPPLDEDPNFVESALSFVGVLPAADEQYLVKRIIGMPGDTVECCSADGKLTINGTVIDEPYVYAGNAPSDMEFKVTVPEGKIWVMGDHRAASADSRFHTDIQGGFVDLDSVQGKASVISWPISRWGGIDSHSETFAQVPAPNTP